MEEIEYLGHIIHIKQDEDPMSPRDWDNLGTMVCTHRRNNYGDEQLSGNADGWMDDFEKYLSDKGLKLKDVIYLPVYMLDHGGVCMQTHSFNDRWDSGQVGYIYVSKAKVRKEFVLRKISPEVKKRAEKYLIGEVEIYSQWLSGETYGISIDDDEGFEYGYFGYLETIQAGKDKIDWMIKNESLSVIIENNA